MSTSRRLIGNIAALRALLLDLEATAGLTDLPRAEREVLCAAHSAICDGNNILQTDGIRQTPLGQQLSQPTFHRALRNLVLKGYLHPVPGRKRGAYRLGPE